MQVQGTQHTAHVHGTHGPNKPHFRPQPASTQSAAPVDALDISPEAAAAADVSGTSGEIRTGLVAKLRAEIAQGTYETADKLNASLDRLLNEIG